MGVTLQLGEGYRRDARGARRCPAAAVLGKLQHWGANLVLWESGDKQPSQEAWSRKRVGATSVGCPSPSC